MKIIDSIQTFQNKYRQFIDNYFTSKTGVILSILCGASLSMVLTNCSNQIPVYFQSYAYTVTIISLLWTLREVDIEFWLILKIFVGGIIGFASFAQLLGIYAASETSCTPPFGKVNLSGIFTLFVSTIFGLIFCFSEFGNSKKAEEIDHWQD
jgi:hypothetical protein